MNNSMNDSMNNLNESMEELHDIYKQIKAILEGCDTILDAFDFSSKYIEKYPHIKSMIISMINGKNYRDCVNIKNKQSNMRDIIMCSNKDDADILVSRYSDRSTDKIYDGTMEKIANKKYYERI